MLALCGFGGRLPRSVRSAALAGGRRLRAAAEAPLGADDRALAILAQGAAARYGAAARAKGDFDDRREGRAMGEEKDAAKQVKLTQLTSKGG